MKDIIAENINVIFTISATIALGMAAFYYYSSTSSPPPQKRPFLDGKRKKMKIIGKDSVSPDSFLFTFSIGDYTELGLPICQHLKVFSPNPTGKVPGQWNGKPTESGSEIFRKYTPISHSVASAAQLIIKVYRKDENPSFPDGGKVSQYFETLEVGDFIDVDGPVGKMTYLGKGVFLKDGKTHTFKKLALLAGGTGITPHFQLISAILEDSRDNTEMRLIYASKTEKDIFLRKEFDELEKNSNGQFKITYTIDKATKDWPHESGYINTNMIQKYMPGPSEDTLVIMCGPNAMKLQAIVPSLKELGYDFNFVWNF
uniref:NADH-cytochrome b5 reductase n=1 Tax=Nephromyces sp. MMRI TaxID=2496275 RepID=A0A3Q8UBP4_9APIC|nr:NADH-dependent fumarate reductase [Nephromyces sp. MMRI]AZL94388.1 NADH-dependent fumarate reductase [Nephromyces sp. MMRI]